MAAMAWTTGHGSMLFEIGIAEYWGGLIGLGRLGGALSTRESGSHSFLLVAATCVCVRIGVKSVSFHFNPHTPLSRLTDQIHILP
jgi:hypothetical protein